MLNLRRIEWPTVWLATGATLMWGLTVYLIGAGQWWLWPLTILAMTLHSSLQHEMLHGHPTSDRHLNEAFVFLPVGLAYPFRRFKALHLQHHFDERLTDPFEDPESNYMSPEQWASAGPLLQRLRLVNNTQLGRLLIGPVFSVVGFVDPSGSSCRRMRGRRAARLDTALDFGLVAVFWWVSWVSGINPIFYIVCFAYPTLSMLSVRTFIEHQAVPESPHRTIINEDRGLFAFLFLFNNLDLVSTTAIRPWLGTSCPASIARTGVSYLAGNGGYFAKSYGEVLRQYGLRRKEPVWSIR